MSDHRNIPYEWLTLLGREDVVILDCETTGTEAHDEICELGAINTLGEVLIHEYIMPQCEISEGAASIHGLTKERLSTLDARPYTDVGATAVTKHLKGASLIIAYNVSFDLRLLAQTIRKYALDPPAVPWRCAMLDYAEHKGQWNPQKNGYRWWKLGQAAEMEGLSIAPATAHTAVGDCRTTLALMWAVGVRARPAHGRVK